MIKGGYQIINFNNRTIPSITPKEIADVYGILSSSLKVVLISGLNIDGSIVRDFFVTVSKENDKYILTGDTYVISITDNTIALNEREGGSSVVVLNIDPSGYYSVVDLDSLNKLKNAVINNTPIVFKTNSNTYFVLNSYIYNDNIYTRTIDTEGDILRIYTTEFTQNYAEEESSYMYSTTTLSIPGDLS